MIAVIGLLIGIVIGVVWHPVVPTGFEPYLPIAIVAALDAVFGGFRAIMEKRFDDRIFVVSFLSNVVIASFLVFLGDQLGVGAQMSTGVVVVLAMRIFANAAAIRRILFRA
jgi:small basic protein